MTDTKPIDKFTGRYRFLSNFYPARVLYDGYEYPTVEHAFQAAKSLSWQDRAAVGSAPSPGEARDMGRSLELRYDWEDVKENVMLALLHEKFFPCDFRSELVDTDPRELIEGNTWGDVYWGVCNGKGRNRLGFLLMRVRTETSVR